MNQGKTIAIIGLGYIGLPVGPEWRQAYLDFDMRALFDGHALAGEGFNVL